MQVDLWQKNIIEDKPEEKVKKVGLFDCIKALNQGKDIRYSDPELKSFDAFMVNKALQQSSKTVGYANMMNKLRLPKIAVYLFYLNALPKTYSYSSWSKKTKDKQKDKLLEYYPLKHVDELMYVLSEKEIKSVIKKLKEIK